MATPPKRLRDIVEEPRFSEQLDQLAISYQRRDEILEAIGFVLSRHPEMFPHIPGTSLSAVKVKIYADAPPIRILFAYNEDRVSLIGVDFTPIKDEGSPQSADAD